MDKFCVIIPAAGQGKRMNSCVNKQFLQLLGIPVIIHTLRAFQASENINHIILVCAPGEEEYYRQEILHKYDIAKPTTVVAGGKERQDSVRSGLAVIDDDCKYVMIHDGARPLVTEDLISRLADEVRLSDAAVAGVQVKDTIKKSDAKGYVVETLQRDRLWHVQTPQVFNLNLVKKAHELAKAAGYYGTDDATLVEWMGAPVKLVPGIYENIKITTPEDIITAEAILKRRGSR